MAFSLKAGLTPVLTAALIGAAPLAACQQQPKPAAPSEAKAPVEAPAAGKPSGFGAVKGASSANLLNFSPASALEGTGEEQCGIKPSRKKD